MLERMVSSMNLLFCMGVYFSLKGTIYQTENGWGNNMKKKCFVPYSLFLS
jgi:hypothetical protein